MVSVLIKSIENIVLFAKTRVFDSYHCIKLHAKSLEAA